MKKFILLISVIFLPVILINASNTTSLTSPVPTKGSLAWFSSLSMKELQKLAGKKFTLKEKIAVKILQWKIKKGYKIDRENTGSKKGRLAKTFGFIGIVAIFIPYVGPLVSIISLILALVLGYQARKEDPEDRHAKTAITLGWITLGIFALATIIAIAVLSSVGFGWG